MRVDLSYFWEFAHNGIVRRGSIGSEDRRPGGISDRFPETTDDPPLISGGP